MEHISKHLKCLNYTIILILLKEIFIFKIGIYLKFNKMTINILKKEKNGNIIFFKVFMIILNLKIELNMEQLIF